MHRRAGNCKLARDAYKACLAVHPLALEAALALAELGEPLQEITHTVPLLALDRNGGSGAVLASGV